MARFRIAYLFLAVCLAAGSARAQNPVQWSANVQQSVNRANELSLPVLFWVSGGSEEDDLEDAQEECFRDPLVVNMIHDHFVPVRVSRTSRVLEEAKKLGLPTAFGRYCAVVTARGKLLDQMGPGEVADPKAFASHLASAYSRHCDDLYENELRPLLQDHEASKSKVRLAAQTVWRLRIRRADADVIGLLDRPDLTGSERSRLYTLLASLGTKDSINTLLDRAADDSNEGAGAGDAEQALRRAEPNSLEWLIPAMPGEQAPATWRQLVAYRSAMQVCHLASPKPDRWWNEAQPDERRGELDRVAAKAQAVLDYWRQAKGAPR